MRGLLVLIGFAVGGQASASDSTYIDGVLVYGKLHNVSVSDMHEAVAGVVRNGLHKPAALEVYNNGEISAYLPSRDLGWIPMHRVTVYETDGREHPGWSLDGREIRDFPEALHFIKSADEVYVFPITTPDKLHRDDKHLRLLDPEAREKLVQLLGDQQDWFEGFDDTVWVAGKPKPTSVGFVFRRGRTELVLFFPVSRKAEGTFDGRNMSGTLDNEIERKWEEWKSKYAQRELAAR